MPETGRKVDSGGEAAVVESVKAASEVYAPVSGEVTGSNGALVDDPAKVNADPEGEGWFFKLQHRRQVRIRQADERYAIRGIRERVVVGPRPPIKSGGRIREVCSGHAGEMPAVPKPGECMRYLPLTSDDRIAMLAKIGAPHIDALFRDVPKEAMVAAGAFDLPDHEGELEVERALSRLAAKNVAAGAVPFFCGAGAYRHHVPAAVDHLIQRSEFLTSYTPYQPEIAQGTLQYLFEFQTQVALLTGMEVANASLYDGSTATAEAVLMAQRITRRPRPFSPAGLHPHYAETTETMAAISGQRYRMRRAYPERPRTSRRLIDDETACVVVQSPDVFGLIRDLRPIAEAAHAKGALLIAVVTEIVSLGLVEAPGAQGADIVAAEGQSIGNGLNFGGPYVGLFATREKFVRQMPGRLVGETDDAGGKRGYVLTLVDPRTAYPPREGDEQHLHQFGAVQPRLYDSSFASRRRGFLAAGARQPRRAAALADRLAGIKGVSLVTQAFFNEFTLKLPTHAATVVDTLAAKGIIAGVPASRLMPHNACVRDLLIVAATETTSDADCDAFVQALAEVLA